MLNVSGIVHELELWKRSARGVDDYAGVVNQVMLSGGDLDSLKGVVIDDEYCIRDDVCDDEVIDVMERIIGVDYCVCGY